MHTRRAFLIACAFAAPAHAELLYGYTTSSALVSFNSSSPGVLLSNSPITGLATGESIRAIDSDASGNLYVLGSSSRLYRVNTTTATLTQVGSGTFSIPLAGTSFGFDIHHAGAFARTLSNTGQSLRIDLATGQTIAADPAPSFAPGDPNFGISPSIVAIAFNPAGSLLALDFNLDILASLNPSTGALSTIGSLTINAQSRAGLEVSPFTGATFASMFLPNSMGATSLYSINPASGAATSLGFIGGGLQIDGVAVVPAPAPALLLLAAPLLSRRRPR